MICVSRDDIWLYVVPPFSLKVADAKDNLEKALQMSLRLGELTSTLRDWLTTQIKGFSGGDKRPKKAKSVVDVATGC